MKQKLLRTVSVLVAVFILIPSAIAQRMSVTGKILDASGQPVVGAGIVEKDTNNGVVSDLDGNYAISVNRGTVLEVSCIGFRTVEVVASSATLNITLEEDVDLLEESVVVGYGTQKKKLLTGANLNVKSDDIQKRNSINVLDALIGQSPGVSIIQASGQPGDDIRVNIRGLGTVGDATPLYVVDGVQVSSIGHLSPSEIESIDVLKDAASAAIYGARAANGVMLITTKQGREGNTRLSYDGTVGVQNFIRIPEMLNAMEYMDIQNEAYVNSGRPPIDWMADFGVNASAVGTGTNWIEEIIHKNAITHNHSLSMSGGSKVSTFSMSLGLTDQEGVFGGKDFSNNTRYNFRVNSTHKFFGDIFRMGEHLSLSYIDRKGIAMGNQYNNIIQDALRAVPFRSVYNADGSDFSQSTLWYAEETHPVAALNLRNLSTNQTGRLSGDVFAELRPVKDLVIKTSFALDYMNNNGRSYTPVYDYGTGFRNDTDYVSQSNTLRTSWSWENTANYKFNIGGRHNFDLLGGMQMRRATGRTLSATKYNLIFDDFEHAWITNATETGANTITVAGAPIDLENLVSYFGRLSYDYREKYMFSATVRADGSSKFGLGNRFGVFPSVSAGWVISNEDFWEPLKGSVNFLKFRASWGQNGNDRIRNYVYLATIGTTSYAFGKGDGINQSQTTNGVYENSMPNANVRWETSEQIDFGIDAHFFGSKLQIAADYYTKTTKDWLVQADVLDVFGAASNPYVNGGSVRNRGFELGASYSGGIGKDFTYNINTSLTFNKNKVMEIPNEEGIIHGSQDVLFKGMQEMNRCEVGYPIGYFWGLNMLGIFQTQAEVDGYKDASGKVIQPSALPGDIKWEDVNGDGEISQADNIYLGQPYPVTTAGINISMGYKGFDLYIAGNGSFGMQVAKCYRPKDRMQYNYEKSILGRWTGQGTSNTIPRVTDGAEGNGNYLFFSQIYLEDADFFRVNNITLGYDFARLMGRTKYLSSLRGFFTVQNAFVITKYSGMDPEVGYSGGSEWASGIDLGYYPKARTMMLGLSVKF